MRAAPVLDDLARHGAVLPLFKSTFAYCAKTQVNRNACNSGNLIARTGNYLSRPLLLRLTYAGSDEQFSASFLVDDLRRVGELP